MIPEAEWRRELARNSSEVRYPAWYPWFLRGEEGKLDGREDQAGTVTDYRMDGVPHGSITARLRLGRVYRDLVRLFDGSREGPNPR